MVERVRACAVCIHERRILAVEMRDPTSHDRFWTLPGGEIEAGESPEEAAVRETLEETGYVVTPEPGPPVRTEYPFHWDGSLYECTTWWVPARLADSSAAPARVDDASYVLACDWIPVADAGKRFSYHEAIRDTIVHMITRAT